jgi:hypothetical protein
MGATVVRGSGSTDVRVRLDSQVRERTVPAMVPIHSLHTLGRAPKPTSVKIAALLQECRARLHRSGGAQDARNIYEDAQRRILDLLQVTHSNLDSVLEQAGVAESVIEQLDEHRVALLDRTAALVRARTSTEVQRLGLELVEHARAFNVRVDAALAATRA